MKNLKSVLALVMALCLMLCLAVPAFATETTAVSETVVETTAAAETEAAAETTAAAETEALDAAPVETAPAEEEVKDEHEGHDHGEETGDTLTTGTADVGASEKAKMGPVRIILIVLEVIASLILVVVIMAQSGKEGGMGALSGNSESYMGQGNVSGRDQILAKTTKWVTVIWVVLTMLLTLIP